MSTTATYFVEGMTCDHCVRAVTSELTALGGVSDVRVELHPENVSVVTVTSQEPSSIPLSWRATFQLNVASG